MNFTPKKHARVVSGILTVAVVGLIGWAHHAVPRPVPITAEQNSFVVQQSLQPDNAVLVNPVAEPAAPLTFDSAGPVYYQPISSWYKSKHWWKRNAPIVGGAAGGAVVGGLIGGGPGALVGGAVGGGGGYLYKRSRHHHHHY